MHRYNKLKHNPLTYLLSFAIFFFNAFVFKNSAELKRLEAGGAKIVVRAGQ